MDRSATIVIAARNAAATIGRAVRSARAQGDYPILLIDDHSTDATSDVARREAPALHVVRPPHHGMLGFTRQFGLEQVRTPYALWLDADDELLPGRAERLVRAMAEAGSDLAFDELELVDGASGISKGVCPIPSFLDRPPYLLRLFERNHLPGVGQVAFRTESARAVGYDAELHGPEDSDFVLRGLVSGLRATLVREVGYRMYAYRTSVSRQLDNQRAMYRKALRKHAYPEVRRLFERAGAPPRVTVWALISLAMFREELDAALAFVDEAARLIDDPHLVDESDGPCPMPEGWRVAFYRGTLHAQRGEFPDARAALADAHAISAEPDSANNLGVALAATGDLAAARDRFRQALSTRPDYLDAQLNLESRSPNRITTHPLRRVRARADYAA
jgi:glycosyltransferase involved in cell wall biosynthesis